MCVGGGEEGKGRLVREFRLGFRYGLGVDGGGGRVYERRYEIFAKYVGKVNK